LNRGIAMGLVAQGPDRMGEILNFPDLSGNEVKVKLVDPVFYDKNGDRQNV